MGIVSNGPDGKPIFIPFEEERDDTLENFYLYLKAKGIHHISREELKEPVDLTNDMMVQIEVEWANFSRETGLA